MPLRVYGDGQQTRAFSAIEDVLPCLWTAGTAAAASRQIINVGGTRARRIMDAALLVNAMAGYPGIEHVEPRHEVQQAWSTWGKSVELLGYEDKTPLVDGLMRMWKWAKHAWHQYPERRDPPPITMELEL
jgi:UDP-glucose 4-epimerase